MVRRKGLGGRYPSSFGEWVVGMTIEDAFGSRTKQPPRQRDIVKFEVTTDDETEEDSLRVTYPRSGRSVTAVETSGAVVKKVRFEETPQKSAMKKAIAASSESDNKPSDSTATSESEQDTTEAESSDASAKKPPKVKKSKKNSSNSASEDDSEPHPSCKCAECVRGREKSKRCKAGEKQQSATDSEASISDADGAPKARSQDAVNSKKKGGNKGKEKRGESEAGREASDSEAEPRSKNKGGDDNQQQPNKPRGKEKRQGKGEGTQQREKEADKAANADEPQAAKEDDTGKEPTKEPETAAEDGRKKSKSRRGGSGKKMGNYPEAFLAPHPRRPQLLEPIRAEVVQTERVVETPEDPPPNAYYDPEHGVLRIYHGPVYGSHQGRALYPRRDGPLPVGMPHPAQNPYYYGFNQLGPLPVQTGQEPVPITQGMPIAPWNAMCPPPGFAPGYPGGFPQGGIWQGADVNANGNKGAFDMSGANGGSPFSKHRDKDGANNVAPGSVKGLEKNPYYAKQNRSQFSTYGSRVPSNASQRSGANNAPGSNAANTGVPSMDGPGDTGQRDNGTRKGSKEQPGTWGTGGNQEQQGTWDSGGNQEQQPEWNNGTKNGATGNGGAEASGWDNGVDGGNGQASGNDGWGNTKDGPVSSGGDGNYPAANGAEKWGNTDSYPPVETTNVMPGSWDTPGSIPIWGDLTAAASTKGQVDAW